MKAGMDAFSRTGEAAKANRNGPERETACFSLQGALRGFGLGFISGAGAGASATLELGPAALAGGVVGGVVGGIMGAFKGA